MSPEQAPQGPPTIAALQNPRKRHIGVAIVNVDYPYRFDHLGHTSATYDEDHIQDLIGS